MLGIFKRLPQIQLELHDLEQEQRDELAKAGLSDSRCLGQLGLEYRFEAFNQAGEKVCCGKIELVPESADTQKQILVQQIYTEKIHRRQGYAASAILTLSHRFGSLPITPVGEFSGLRFWTALRRKRRTAAIVKPGI